jgi:3-hydroxybutyrate dehydrogenase
VFQKAVLIVKEKNMDKKIAVVTGSGSEGIGREICLDLARNGYFVVGLDINDVENEITIQHLRDIGFDGEAIHCDITDKEQVKNVIDDIGYRHKKIDVLINNAGFSKTISLVNDDYYYVAETHDKLMHVNAFGPFYVSLAVAQYMVSEKSGKIVNLLTHHVKFDKVPFKVGFNAYSAAKQALWIHNMNFAAELYPYGISVNGICPASVYTPMLKGYFEDKGLPSSFEAIKEIQKTLLRPEEVALAIRNILSWDLSKYDKSTGHSIVIRTTEDCEALSNPENYTECEITHVLNR